MSASLKVLIGCEHSGVVRRAFRARGHAAWSCDLLPAADGSRYHYQGDVRDILDIGWDLAIFHPDCTYLCNSSAWAFAEPNYVRWPGKGYHQNTKPGTVTGAARRIARAKAVQFVWQLWTAPIPRIAIENPIGYLSHAIGRPAQVIQPYQFGDDASKQTCLWLKGLSPLVFDQPGGAQDRQWAQMLGQPDRHRAEQTGAECRPLAEAGADISGDCRCVRRTMGLDINLDLCLLWGLARHSPHFFWKAPCTTTLRRSPTRVCTSALR